MKSALRGNTNLLLVAAALLAVVAAGYFWLQTQQTPAQPKPAPTESTTNANTPSPATSPDPTADWETFTNNELSFKYPSHWTFKGYEITGKNPDIRIYWVTKDSTLMNECMRQDKTEKKNGFAIRKFSGVTAGGGMCSTFDSNEREIWVVPTEDDYAPGINYIYSSKDNPEAENIFNQILSTFEFTE